MTGDNRARLPSALMIGIGAALTVFAFSCTSSSEPADDGALDSGVGVPTADAGNTTADAGNGPAGPDAATSCEARGGAVGDLEWTLDSGGRERTLRVHVPASYDPTAPTPVVLNFHGYTSNAWQQEAYSGMADKADAAGFIAVHPEGVSNSWNAGSCCGGAAQTNVDDVGFVEDILDRLSAEYCVDEGRVYATGMSNGGFMSHRLACDLSHRIAAIASVAGYDVTQSCAPTRAVPVMHFHGTADGTVSYNGVATTINAWIQRNACDSAGTTTYDNGNASCETYRGCDDGAEVVSCTIEGGGHTWPGAYGNSAGIDATDALWDFVSAFRMP